ncbi:MULTISPECIES: response regulator [Phenylobacterium]|jgi:CheY-like chemotaxis protein|uniref:histidine kinase n=1 Tax=Phenylobacterium conjunctum TaxID=1298959 RepID=A0ABW3T390_9CAUL
MSPPAPPRITAEHLAALSHEFRTPLNGVLGMARLLEGTGLTDEQRTYVAALRESGQHLLGLVNDVLDFAKLGAGKVELVPAEFEVEDLLRGVCELMAPRAQEKGLEVAWAAPAGLGRAFADEGRLRQVLLNFAGNAIKFTPKGGVLVHAEVTGPDRLRLTVEDTGPGVAEADREKIFEAFGQADPVHDGVQLGGAGLGLAIVRTLAQTMGGEAGVGSAPGGGAAFWIEITAPLTPANTDDSLAGRRVAVACANPVTALAAEMQLSACGAQASLHETLEALPAEAEVVLIDHALAGSAPPDDRPALVLLNPEERGRIADYRAAGYAGYLIKPLRRASLAERVQAALGQDAARHAAEDERVAPAAAPGARILLVEDNPINALLARTLLTREGCKVDHATGGDEALAALAVGAYDLILMDMRMPGMSGLEATRRLRAQGVATPVVALTANAFEDDRHACLDAGMDDFLVKPLSADALRGVLARLARGGWTPTTDHAKVS